MVLNSLVLHIHFICACTMFGLILIIQFVHYPSFKSIEKSKFRAFHSFHSKSISLIVVPIMTTEFLTGLALMFNQSFFFYLNFFLIVCVWGVTFFVSVPNHNRLSSGYKEAYVESLIYTNWFRTAIWSTKVLLLLFIYTSQY